MIRWLRWKFKCKEGSECVPLRIGDCDAPPGAIITVEYECGGCGTLYNSTGIAGRDGTVAMMDRFRITERSIVAFSPGRTMDPGEMLNLRMSEADRLVLDEWEDDE